MLIGILRKFFGLFFLTSFAAFGQQAVNEVDIELGLTTFPIERPFTISVTIIDSEKRESIAFPSIPGFIKKGVTTSTSASEINGKSIVNQVITQSYQALAPGRFRLLPFDIEANETTAHSDGSVLIVQPGEATAATTTPMLDIDDAALGSAAFLSLQASKKSLYAGEGVALTLSFFVADTYPYALNFTALDKQLQLITRKIHPANSWEENLSITELKPSPVVIRGKKFREFRLYQSVFFPLSNQNLKLPPVSLQLARPQPKIGPPSAASDVVTFTSKQLVINVKALPAHPLRGRVPVGVFQLEEALERQRVSVGQSVRYRFTVKGEGNIATLTSPIILNETAELNVFPPDESHTLTHLGNRITGYKTFAYFMVPHQNGRISLVNRFQWIYFDPQTGRYDTLQPHLQLQVGGKSVAINEQILATRISSETDGIASGPSLYAGIDALDSTQQSANFTVLARTIANVLILAMLAGMTYIIFKPSNGGH